MSSAVLQVELDKAKKRLAEQCKVLMNCQEIIGNEVALPTLVKIAKARLPKLQQTYDETCKVIQELEKALGLGSQPQLPLSPSPVDNNNKRR